MIDDQGDWWGLCNVLEQMASVGYWSNVQSHLRAAETARQLLSKLPSGHPLDEDRETRQQVESLLEFHERAAIAPWVDILTDVCDSLDDLAPDLKEGVLSFFGGQGPRFGEHSAEDLAKHFYVMLATVRHAMHSADDEAGGEHARDLARAMDRLDSAVDRYQRSVAASHN